MKDAIAVFNEWAELDKDRGMEKGHANAVTEMLDFALVEKQKMNKKFSFLDLGCGNGWVVRKVSKDSLCSHAHGIDGAKQMIENAKLNGQQDNYILADIENYQPNQKYDLIHSMEVLYYLKDPASIIQKVKDSWLNEAGRFIAGIDLYYENSDSHSWEEKVGTRMLMLKEKEWVEIFKQTGLREVKTWRANSSDKWAGTLVLTGKK
jgi:2-polyprenyl-3-methyl-5-hydroxy-6-metoxy-1,4-benzoquinol methylase